MRLHEAQATALGLGECSQRAHLIDHHLVGLVRGDAHVAPAKALQVRQTGMRAHRHATGKRHGHRAPHGARIAAMEAAGDVGRGDMVEHRLVVAHAPGAEALAHVAVEIDDRHVQFSIRDAMRVRNCPNCASRAASSARAASSSMPVKRTLSPGSFWAIRGRSTLATVAILG